MIGPSCPVRSRSRATVWMLQLITMYVADFSPLTHSHIVGGRSGVFSIAVRDSLSLAMAVADLLFRRLGGSKGLVVGILSKLWSFLLWEIIHCLGCALSQLSVVRVH